MDYSLAAVKVLNSQLRDAKPTPSQNATALGGVLFQRAWLQVPTPSSSLILTIFSISKLFPMTSAPVLKGVLISCGGDNPVVLDDGTGLVELSLSSDFACRQWKLGSLTIFIMILLICISGYNSYQPSRIISYTGMYLMVVGAYVIRTGEIPMIKVIIPPSFIMIICTLNQSM